MKNKAPLPLMEQLIMVLVFALAAALCLQGFSLADQTSHSQENRNHAVVLAQNMAECLKASAGNYETLAAQSQGIRNGQALTVCYDKNWQVLSDTPRAVYILQVTPIQTDHSLLGKALIQVKEQDDILFEITVAWQEVENNVP